MPAVRSVFISDPACGSLSTLDRPLICSFHGYPWLIHLLAVDMIDRIPSLAEADSWVWLY
jgi:phosphoketolase